jgi:hypothetical protein
LAQYLGFLRGDDAREHSGNPTITPGQAFLANLEIHILVAAGEAASAYVVKIGQHGNITG